MKRIAFCCLLSALSSAAGAQGFLPPQSSSTVKVSSDTHFPLLIGDKIPESAIVTDENGKKRSLLSFKSPLEVLAVGFFSARCPEQEAQWRKLARFYEDFKDWRVAMVAVNAGPAASADELAKTMEKHSLKIPLLIQEDHNITRLFKIEKVPTILLIDESGYLQYRGPAGPPARKAIEILISHIESIKYPEPPFDKSCPVQ